jgi:uncharacterized protein YqcC (DUF446 family)
MHNIPSRIADVLLELEANLRVSGKWQCSHPGQEALASPLPFSYDTLSFEQWLQWVFLPKMKHILEQSRPLPSKSGIYEYAWDVLPRSDQHRKTLLRLIKRFDDLILIQQGARHH